MSQKKKTPAYFQAANFASALQDLIAALPTEERKKEIDADFRRIIEFLTDAKGRFAALPTREDSQPVRAALDRLTDLAVTAKDNPTIAAALGSRIASAKRSSAPFTANEIAGAKETLTLLESLPINELRAKLEDPVQFSVRSLQLIAKQMNVRLSPRLSRDALVHQIATRISNFRGYQDLGNTSPRQSADIQVEDTSTHSGIQQNKASEP